MAPLPSDHPAHGITRASDDATAARTDAGHAEKPGEHTVLTKDVWMVTEVPGPCTAPPSIMGCTWYLSPEHPPSLAVETVGDRPATVDFAMRWSPSTDTNQDLTMDVYDSTENQQHLVSGSSPVTLTLELLPGHVYEIWPMPASQGDVVVHQEVELQASGVIEEVPDHHDDTARAAGHTQPHEGEADEHPDPPGRRSDAPPDRGRSPAEPQEDRPSPGHGEGPQEPPSQGRGRGVGR